MPSPPYIPVKYDEFLAPACKIVILKILESRDPYEAIEA